MGDHVHGSLVDLVLDGAVQHVQRLPGTLVQELVQQEREPEYEDEDRISMKFYCRNLSWQPLNLGLNGAKRLVQPNFQRSTLISKLKPLPHHNPHSLWQQSLVKERLEPRTFRLYQRQVMACIAEAKNIFFIST